MASILIGTASWTDKTLIDSGKFYPPTSRSAEDRLRFYSSQFPIVEVDSSYYGLPTAETAQLWAERTPPDFRFNVKSFRLFTGHQTPPAAIPKDVREVLEPFGKKNIYYREVPEEIRDELWSRFREALEPLRLAGKLGAIHFQFAPWMAFHPENFAHLDECMAQLPGHQLAVEFRNLTWFNSDRHTARTLDFERERNLVNVIVDEPQGVGNHIPAIWEVTNPELAIVRLHGRNHEMWNKKGLKSSAQRFDYDYSEEELGTLALTIKKLAESVKEVDVVFNNNYEDQGQRNARSIAKILHA